MLMVGGAKGIAKVEEWMIAFVISFLFTAVVATSSVASEPVLPCMDGAGEQLPEEIEFDGFGIDLQSGRTGISQALRAIPSSDASADEGLPVDLLVTGPSSSQAGRGAMTAEVGQQFSFVSVAAGMLADRDSIFSGPAGWTSRLSMEFERETASGGLELRTQFRQTNTRQTVGIDLGPRLEHRLPRGIRLFFEGNAQARAEYDRSGELIPTGGPLQRPEVIGLSGTVGIAR